MEKYIEILPYFLVTCGVGITASLLFTNNDKITRIRIVRELFGAIWMSAFFYFMFKQFLSWNDEFVYVTLTLVSFLNSRIINFVGKDLIESLFKGILNKIKSVTTKTEE